MIKDTVKGITFDEIRTAIEEFTDSQKETDRQLNKIFLLQRIYLDTNGV